MGDSAPMATARPTNEATEPARLSQAGEVLVRLLDAAPVGMLVATRTGDAVYANQAFTDLIGREPLGALNVTELIHPDDNAAARQQFERLTRGETKTYRGEHRFRHADGSPLWVMVAVALLDGGDDEDMMVLQLTSIELQKKAEEALVYSENRWNSALESARQGVWDYDMRRDSMFYSHMWRVLRGIPDNEPIGENHDLKWLERIHPDDRERVRSDSKKQGLGRDGHDTLEYRELTRDGRYIWILSRGKPIEWDESGRVLRSVGIDTDITHLKTVEHELAAEKERLRVTLEAMADGMISTDAEGRIVFMNPAAEALTGYSASQAQGRIAGDVFKLRSEANDSELPCPTGICLEQAMPIRSDDDTVLVSRGGEHRDIRCTASPVTTQGGSVSGVVLVFQDVTQSRALQRQLAHSAAHDVLTGLPNRAAFERALTDAISSARSGTRSHSLIYIDLDCFKPVNDTAGHAAGDALLQHVGKTIRGACRSHDMAARIGGDEFAIILEDCPMENGMVVGRKVVRAIRSLVFTWAGREYTIGASAGLTTISAQPASPLGFMGEADAACYAAKAGGRGRVIAFSEMGTPVSRNTR
jgi:diguanylate cyclase (GGDEF)-like protein/PAS domain S-box-containing protein